jgi:hypothetical protein
MKTIELFFEKINLSLILLFFITPTLFSLETEEKMVLDIVFDILKPMWMSWK